MVGFIAVMMILALVAAVVNLLPPGAMPHGTPRLMTIAIVGVALVACALFVPSMFRAREQIASPSASDPAVQRAVQPAEPFRPGESAAPPIAHLTQPEQFSPPAAPGAENSATGQGWVVIAPAGKWSEKVTIPNGYTCSFQATDPVLVEKNGRNVHREQAFLPVQLGRVAFARFKSGGATPVTIIGKCANP